MTNDIMLPDGPVTAAIKIAIAQCKDEIARQERILARGWYWRWKKQLPASEARRCIDANRQRVIALEHAKRLAEDIEEGRHERSAECLTGR